ncbi:MAG: Flagellin N-methylase [Methanoregulaceae archaeon PtaU1.Bin059]|nr:MAG: Flagellin N-methylase [Methanoregulaceae archaeon PtaB.Bin152]OPY36592.1 MAG: Flagellin N-methylase [Methanoregulaceae archaeon PtaU1.Bin059]
MPGSFEETAEAICAGCGGKCCHEAHPPLSPARIEEFRARGVPPSVIEFVGYTRMKSHDNGMCIMCSGGKCRVHAFKPETCVAGPFTFEVQDHTLRLFLKHETICPLVPYLKADADAYATQFRMAVKSLMVLVRSLPAQELDVINRIPEPETELVAEIPIPPGESGAP